MMCLMKKLDADESLVSKSQLTAFLYVDVECYCCDKECEKFGTNLGKQVGSQSITMVGIIAYISSKELVILGQCLSGGFVGVRYGLVYCFKGQNKWHISVLIVCRVKSCN